MYTVAFSEIASKVSECPSANRGGNLGTFKPGMMVPEIDKVCFEEEVGKVYGPIETQFGSHLVSSNNSYKETVYKYYRYKNNCNNNSNNFKSCFRDSSDIIYIATLHCKNIYSHNSV